ncbi:hypothetical protein V8F33_003876 [Rhypophila sp. PSN 637]
MVTLPVTIPRKRNWSAPAPSFLHFDTPHPAAGSALYSRSCRTGICLFRRHRGSVLSTPPTKPTSIGKARDRATGNLPPWTWTWTWTWIHPIRRFIQHFEVQVQDDCYSLYNRTAIHPKLDQSQPACPSRSRIAPQPEPRVLSSSLFIESLSRSSSSRFCERMLPELAHSVSPRPRPPSRRRRHNPTSSSTLNSLLSQPSGWS